MATDSCSGDGDIHNEAQTIYLRDHRSRIGFVYLLAPVVVVGVAELVLARLIVTTSSLDRILPRVVAVKLGASVGVHHVRDVEEGVRVVDPLALCHIQLQFRGTLLILTLNGVAGRRAPHFGQDGLHGKTLGARRAVAGGALVEAGRCGRNRGHSGGKSEESGELHLGVGGDRMWQSGQEDGVVGMDFVSSRGCRLYAILPLIRSLDFYC